MRPNELPEGLWQTSWLPVFNRRSINVNSASCRAVSLDSCHRFPLGLTLLDRISMISFLIL